MIEYNEMIHLLKIISIYELHDYLHWNISQDGSLKFMIECDDIFGWGVSDSEPVENCEDVKLLEKSIQTCVDENCDSEYGAWLYCVRKRDLSPQAPIFIYLPKEIKPFFITSLKCLKGG